MPRSSKNIDEPARPVISDPHDILMNAPIGVFTSTPEGSLIYANHALADMYGYADPQDLVTSVQNIGAELFADPKDPPVVNRLLANEGTVRNYECEHIRMDGSRFWASENIRTVYAEDGSISHYQGFVTDITERKAADNQWQDTFDSVPDMIALIDTSHRILRDKAESRLDQEEFLMDDLSSHEIKALIHDLRVHQIELEMQNEELRYAQKQLEFTRDQFARLYNDAPLGYLTIDENSIIVRTNQTFAVMLGLEPHQIIGASLAEYVVPEDKGAFYGRFHAFFRHPDGKHLDFRIKGVSGELVVRCFGRLENEFEVHSGGKASKTMLVAVSDVSRQVRAESILREREQYLNAILETTQDGFLTLNEQGRVLDVNAAFCSISGYTRDELLQMSIPDLEALESPSETKTRLKRINAGRSERFETRHRRKDGTAFDVEVSVSCIEVGGGKFVCFCRDITERKKAEIALRRREEEYLALAENAPDIVARFDRHLRHVFINKVIEKYSGIQQDKFIGNTNEDLHMPDEQVQFWNSKLKKVFQEGQETEMFFDFPGPLMKIYFHSRIVPEFSPDGSVEYVLSITRDITQQKMAEEKISLINQQLEKVNAEKDKLFTIIAHDLKSPISGIFSTSQILSKDAEFLSLDEICLISTEMHKSSKNALELLNDLMQWARMSQGGMNFSPEEYSLYELARSSLHTALDVAEKKDIALKCDIPHDLTVLVDQPMINTVLRNVIFNAVKFANRSGIISITASQTGTDVQVCISDNGIGMSEAILNAAFSVNKSKKQLGTDGEKGTGLGLVLCKEFVEKHGGRIWLESEPSKGTKVYFTLPGTS